MAPGRIIDQALPQDIADLSVGSGDEAPLLTGQVHSGNVSPSEASFNESASIPNGAETPATEASLNNGPTSNAGMPIAIIGIAVRAGSASTPDEFFEMLSRGRSSWVPDIPKERFNNASFYHPNAGKLGCINTNGACFIKQDITKFDAPFFSMTELEATSLDPQQRLLLECAFEAIENAGVQKHATVGKDVGVFIGAGSPEYEIDLFRDSDTMPMFQATGNHLAMQSNRISHFFDWRGPSVTMDTACSSSLTALHYACQSIRNGESKIALAGGCNLNIIPEYFINYSTSRLMGNDGRSFSFDARGTGYGRGEGCGMILLKPLDQAVKDNDSIRAVIAASGVNQDGHTPGITMPNGESQEALVRSVYEKAGLDPSQTGYVEAHGTGTRVGDPIEVTALHNVFKEGRTARNPLYLGSVKSNIGHLESASGILAVIKTAVALDRGFVLPNHDFKVGNPKIPFSEWGLKVPVRQLPWPRGKRFASINNFGFGGTNAHVVMERAPPQTSNDAFNTIKEDPTKKLFVLSAADKATCQTLLSNLVVYLEQRPEMFQRDLMSNVAYTLGQRRSLLPWRVAIPATESFQLIETISKGGIQPVKESGSPRIGFVCTGQGAQWWAMGRELYERYPVFKDTLDKASAILAGLDAPYDLIEELSLDEKTTRVNQAHISQPACTAIQLALIELLRTWNITPTAVVGHSSGEIAAAYAAEVLSLDSAMTIAYHRGRLIPVLKAKHPELHGTMMAVGCGKEEIDPLIQNLNNKEARIACYNSPQSLTISGDTPAIEELSSVLEEKQIFNRKLVIETAYHSHHMELLAEEYHASLQHLPPPDQAHARFFSSLSGKEALYNELDASYWVRNLTNPVKFAQACANLVAPSEEFSTGVDMIIEIGPHAALQGPVKQILKAAGGPREKIPYAGTLARKKNAVDTMFDLASTLFCKGSPVDLGQLNFPKVTKKPSLLIDLPRYPWNHSRKYWHESRIAKVHKHREFPRHDLLGTLANYSNDLEPTWRNIVRLDDLPWLRHHRIQDLTIFPISAFVGMVLEAAAQQAKSNDLSVAQFVLQNINVATPLMVPDGNVEITTTFRPKETDEGSLEHMRNEFLIHSYSEGKGWTLNCTGTVAVKTTEQNEVDGEIQAHREVETVKAEIERINSALTIGSSLSQSSIYSALEGLGVNYGPSFQGLTQCHGDETHAVADITVADTAADMPDHFETKHLLHPSFLEQLVQIYWPMLGAGRGELEVACLPASIDELTVSAKVSNHNSPGNSLRAYSKAPTPLSTEKPSKVSMFAVADGETIIAIDELTVAPLPATDAESDIPLPRELCYKQIWEPILTPLQQDGEVRVDSPNTSNGTTLEATTPITIIHGSSAEQVKLAGMVATTLKNFGLAKVDLGTLEEIDPTDKNLICVTELHEFILSTLGAGGFNALQKITQTAQSLLWVTRGAYGQNGDPTANMVSGFSRAIRSENLFKFATLDLDAEQKLDDTSAVQAILKIFETVAAADTVVNTEMEFQERKGEFWTPRIVNDDTINAYVHKRSFPPAIEDGEFGADDRALAMALNKPGMLDSFYFVDDEQQSQPLADNQIEIQVGAIPVSDRDVQAALGHVDAEGFGSSCSGVVSRVGGQVRKFVVGDRVAAFTQGASFATFARADEDYVLKLLPKSALEQAASLPVAYCSAYHALADLARLEDDESILILNAAGALGQAAISLAQSIGATVFATVETAADKSLLQRLDVSENHIFYSKNDQLARSILKQTGQKGIDVVLSIQADSSCNQAALGCLADFGRFVRDTNSSSKTELSCPHPNSALYSFDLFSLAKSKPRVVKRLMKDVSRSLKYGNLRPIEPSNTLSMSEVSQAFKLARSRPSSGSIVVISHQNDIVKKTPSKQIKELFNPNATYILIGGTGGLGRDMTRWMAGKGARHMVLLSRRGAVTGPVKTLVDDLAPLGVNVYVRNCDVASREDVDRLLGSLSDLPPIKGVIHGAMTLRDKLFDKMAPTDWTEVIESKVQGAWNFHDALVASNTPLDFFIVYSSSAAAMGGRGQTAYAAANSFLDAFVQYRRSVGLPGASLGPTAVMDSGFLFENSEMLNSVKRNIGNNYITIGEVLSLLEASLDGTAQTSCNSHIITGVHLDPLNMPFWSTDAKYKHLRLAAEAIAAQQSGGNGKSKASWNSALKAAATREEAEEVVCEGLVEKIAQTLGLEIEELDPTRNLSNYALDSLNAIDVRNWITREFESTMQVLELLASGTIQTLAKAVCAKSKLLKSG